MKPEYYLKKLRDAFQRDDYEAQTEIAKKLLYWSEYGTVTNEMAMKAAEDGLNQITVYRNIVVQVVNGSMSEKELTATVDNLIAVNPDKLFKAITLTIVDNDSVDVQYTFDSVPIERIRRITGYLVGTLDRFNNAKRAEERDRVKHSLLIQA